MLQREAGGVGLGRMRSREAAEPKVYRVLDGEPEAPGYVSRDRMCNLEALRRGQPKGAIDQARLASAVHTERARTEADPDREARGGGGSGCAQRLPVNEARTA